MEQKLTIDSYLYTKVPPDKSPHGKAGFQMVYIPSGFAKKEVMELESRIHYPGEALQEKVVVFYLKRNGTRYLILQVLRSLSQERDEFGRGGIFIAQGFLLPPAYWQASGRTLDVLSTLLPLVPGSIAEVLAYTHGSLAEGTMKPIEIDTPARNLQPTQPSLSLLQVVFRFCRGDWPQGSLVLQGNPDEVSQWLNACTPYLPSALLQRMEWDSGFDQGKLFFFPIKIVGYTQAYPGNAESIRIEAGQPQNAPQSHEDAFARWMLTLPGTDRKVLDHHYALSLHLAGSGPQPQPFAIEETYLKLASGQLLQHVRKEAQAALGTGWLEALNMLKSEKTALDFVMATDRKSALHHLAEHLILYTPILPDEGKKLTPPPAPTGSLLAAVARLWQQQKLDPTELDSLSAQERDGLIAYLAQTPYLKEPWCLSLVARSPAVIGQMLNMTGFRMQLKKVMPKLLPKPYHNVADELTELLFNQQRVAEFLAGQYTPAQVLEQELANGKSRPKLADAVVADKENTYAPPSAATTPLCYSLVYATTPLPAEIRLNAQLREEFLRVQLMRLQTPETKLLELGFSKKEIAQTLKNNRGALGRFLKELGF